MTHDYIANGLRTRRAWYIVLAAWALVCVVVVAGCSATGGRPRAPKAAPGHASGPTTMTVAMITHGAPGDSFWDLVRKGANDAARNDGVKLMYSSDPQVPNQVNLIKAAIDSHVDGIAVTIPNPSALGPVLAKAAQANIPVVGLNSGMSAAHSAKLVGFFGQDEKVAGSFAGKRLAEAKAHHVLCVIHEQGNISQQERCRGVAEGLGREGTVTTLYVNGQDLTTVRPTLVSKLTQDPSIDYVMTLVAPVGIVAARAVKQASSRAKVATFDTNAQLIDAIRDGRIQFAIDQQPYAQGYLAVDALWLHKKNGTTIGGGRPVFTGPAIVDKTNVDAIAKAAQAGLR